MPDKPKLFWDSSGLIAAIMSPTEASASRQVLRLGEAEVVELCASREVLRDLEYVLRQCRPELLPGLAQALNQASVVITPDPSAEAVAQCLEMTGYLPNARVLAAAIECGADLFVTFDAEHFLRNPLIGPPDTKLRVMAAHQALAWCSEQLKNPDDSAS